MFRELHSENADYHSARKVLHHQENWVHVARHSDLKSQTRTSTYRKRTWVSSWNWLLRGHDRQCPAAGEVACLVTPGRACAPAVALGWALEIAMLSKHGTAFPLQFWRASSRKQRNKKVVAFKAAGESSSQETKVCLLYSCTEVCEQINAFGEAV